MEELEAVIGSRVWSVWFDVASRTAATAEEKEEEKEEVATKPALEVTGSVRPTR